MCVCAPADKDRVSLILYNTYSCDAAWRGVVGQVVEQMNVSSNGAGTARWGKVKKSCSMQRYKCKVICVECWARHQVSTALMALSFKQHAGLRSISVCIVRTHLSPYTPVWLHNSV
jgi:hypothetical protein